MEYRWPVKLEFILITIQAAVDPNTPHNAAGSKESAYNALSFTL
jgi:hypothetical protein